MNCNQRKRQGKKENKRDVTHLLSARENRAAPFCLRSRAFMLPSSEPAGLDSTKHISAPLFPRRLSLSRCVCRTKRGARRRRFSALSDESPGLGLGLCFPPADSILKTVKYSTELQVVHGNVNLKVVMRLARGDDSVYEMCTQTHTDAELRAHLWQREGGGYVIRHQVNSISAVR